MMMRWSCPACGAPLRAETRHAGRRTRCPKCQREVTIPAADASDQSNPAGESPSRGSEPAQQGSGVGKPPSEIGSQPQANETATAGSIAPESEQRQPWEQMEDPNAGVAGDFFDSLREPAALTPDDAGKEAAKAEPAKATSATSSKKRHRNNKSLSENRLRQGGQSPFVPKTPQKGTVPGGSRIGSKPIWITVGAISAALLIGVGILIASGAFTSAPPVVEAPRPAGPPMLIVEWPKGQRGIGKIVLDDKEEHLVTDENGLLEYRLTPGEHKLQIHRAGSAPIETIIPPQKEGARYTFKPEWKEGLPPAPQPDVSTGDRPVAESLPDVKKWQIDLDAAKKEAQQSKKDLLLLFFGADRRDWCLRLAKEVLLKPGFRNYADPKFVLVLFEAPAAKFDEGSTGAKLASDYRISSFPMLVLADSDGLPYAEQDYLDPGHHDYVKSLEECSGKRAERDKLYEPTKTGTDEEKLAGADKFVKWLEDNHMAKLYDTKLKEWIELADRVDPKNEKGYAEKFFLASWEPQFRDVIDKQPKEILPVAEQLDKFRQKHKFKDGNRAAKLHLAVARLFDMKGDLQNTARFLQGAKDCEPTDRQLRRFLEMIGDVANAPLSSGSGFLIDAGGYLVTNNHVVEGPGHLWVRVFGEEKEIRATTVATDPEHDIALVKLDEMPKTPLKPLLISEKTPGPGTDIAVFGFPQGDELGRDMKSATGTISAPPDKSRDGMYLLSCIVNHGNSGGPLCDKRGQVIGLVSAKTSSYGGNDSYGLALPPKPIVDFLKRKLPTLKTGPVTAKTYGAWDEVYERVQPSVVMVLKRTN